MKKDKERLEELIEKHTKDRLSRSERIDNLKRDLDRETKSLEDTEKSLSKFSVEFEEQVMLSRIKTFLFWIYNYSEPDFCTSWCNSDMVAGCHHDCTATEDNKRYEKEIEEIIEYLNKDNG